jgi:predicted nucleic-acid-binding protein
MIGVDTNILVRLAVRDNLRQTNAVLELLESQMHSGQPLYISLVALIEAAWVLAKTYGYNKLALLHWLEAMLASNDFVLADEALVHAAIETFRMHRIDFADAMVAAVNSSAGCEKTVTFDKAGIKAGVMTAI